MSLTDNILIHVGYHKTGTTWLQNHLFAKGNSIFHPLSELDKGISTVGKHFIYSDEMYLLNPEDMNEIAITEAINKALKVNPPKENKMPVLSHEDLSGSADSGGFQTKAIAQRLHNSFPTAKIFISIREQVSMIVSSYFEYLWQGGTHNYQKYLNVKFDGSRPGFSPEYFKYDFLIRSYQQLFGKENVVIIPYEIFLNSKERYFRILGEAIGKEIDHCGFNLQQKEHVKTSLAALYYTKRFNSLRHSNSLNNYSGLSNSITRAFYSIVKQGVSACASAGLNQRLKKKVETYVSEWVDDRYSESNVRTSEMINVDLNELGYRI